MQVDDRRLAGNDNWQVRDGHPRAIEHQTLGRVSAGRTSKGVTLDAAYRRSIGANSAPARGGTLPLWIAARKGSSKVPRNAPRAGLHKMAKQFGVGAGTVQRIGVLAWDLRRGSVE